MNEIKSDLTHSLFTWHPLFEGFLDAVGGNNNLTSLKLGSEEGSKRNKIYVLFLLTSATNEWTQQIKCDFYQILCLLVCFWVNVKFLYKGFNASLGE